MEFAEARDTSANVSDMVASKLGKPPVPRLSSDQKARCSVLFSENEQKQIHESVDQMSQNTSVDSSLVSLSF